MDKRGINGYIEDTLVIDRDTLIFKDSVTGDVIDRNSISAMIKDSEGDNLPKAIIVEIEATHSGITKNFTEYVSENMKNSSHTWLKPYNKPVLINHDPYAPTLGRVKDYEFKRSELNPEKDTIKLKLEITDKASIKRHLDGTALTYSIGATAKQLYCSVCGIDILNSDNFCGHWRGNKYTKKTGEGEGAKEEKVTCIWQIGDMEYLEVSEVNIPADVWAQCLSVTVKKEDAKPSEEDSADVDTHTDSAEDGYAIKDSLGGLDMIDEILAGQQDAKKEEDAKTEEAKTEETKGDIADEAKPDANMTEDAPKNEKTIEDYVTEVGSLTEQISNLTTELNQVKVELQYAQDALEKATEAKADADSKLNELAEKSKQTFAVNVELAKTIKRVYAESIVDAKIVIGQVNDSEKQSELDSLVIKSAKELSDILNGLREEMKERKSLPQVTPAQVGEQGVLAVHQDNVDINGNNKTIDVKVLTANDAVDQIINAKTKR